MLTYYVLHNLIKIIEECIKENNYAKAKESIDSLKKEFIEFIENFWNILKNIENKKISFEE